jgi:Domain of unknown function (DUF4390)
VRRTAVVLALLAATLGATAPGAAQAPALALTLDGATPRVQATALLADGKFLALMRSGFPLRLHYRLELWRERPGWFDDYRGEVSWDVLVRHDPLADDYVVYRTGRAPAHYTDAEALEHALDLPYRVNYVPNDPGRFYYVCRLEISTLDDTELNELSRWLKGEVGPAVSGDQSLGQALARGAEQVLVRIAGLPRLNLEARSTTREVGP